PMNDKLDSAKYLDAIQNIFKHSPLAYANAGDITDKLNDYKDLAFEQFKENQFYEAASLYKALVEKCLEHMDYINDDEGKMGDFIFQVFSYYRSATEKLELDLDWFHGETIKLYLEEDYGFSSEIARLMLNLLTKDNYKILEDVIKKELNKISSNYKKEKLANLLLKIYHKVDNERLYFETCKLFSTQSWERYILAADKYEQTGRMEKAVEKYEEGLTKSDQYRELIEEKYERFKQRMLGLS
ncbi:MAG: hypothetical protein OEZ36_12300, partial [Spirochaetota bacterium]|nr:hypothetical protein [Spirochaetota bacterium]